MLLLHMRTSFQKFAKIVLIIRVANAWPKRGASALRQIMTKMRISMKMDLSNSRLMVSINGPSLEYKVQAIKIIWQTRA